jgi:hypothetical protein
VVVVVGSAVVVVVVVVVGAAVVVVVGVAPPGSGNAAVGTVIVSVEYRPTPFVTRISSKYISLAADNSNERDEP